MIATMAPSLEWKFSPQYINYGEALFFMEERVRGIAKNESPELVWLLEHPPIYTAGSSAKSADLIDAQGFPVYQTGRGGQYTYHGPGQRIAYVMIDLKRRQKDVRKFVCALELWLIESLKVFHVTAERRPGRVGIWVVDQGREKKIAALGIRLHQWISYHGVALNVAPNLTHFQGIIPCGLAEYGVTSLEDLGIHVTLAEVDAVLKKQWLCHPFLTSLTPE